MDEYTPIKYSPCYGVYFSQSLFTQFLRDYGYTVMSLVLDGVD